MNLLLLTKFYPYGNGEAFIENEIKVLANYYDKIFIVACDLKSNSLSKREVPDNVIAYRVPAANKAIDVIKGCFIHRSDVEFQEAKNAKGFKRKVFLCYFNQKCRRIYNYIKKTDLYEKLSAEQYVLYSYWMFATAIVGFKISKDIRPVYSFTRAHRYDLYENRNSLNYLPYRILILENFNNIFPCSEDGARYLSEKYPAYTKKIMPSLLGTIDHGLGVEPENGLFHIVSCSRIAPEKRIHKIISALACLHKPGLKVKWTHIGGGDGLQSIIDKSHQLRDIECEFLGDKPNQQVLQYYGQTPVDVFINVSSSEGLPVSIMEAISFGIPIIATNVGGTSEIVNEKTGILLDENFTDEQCALAITSMISAKTEGAIKSLRLSCRRLWENSFQAEANYNKLCRYIANQIK